MRIEPGGAHSDCEVTANVITQLLTHVTTAEHLLRACAILGTRESAVKKSITDLILQC